MVRVRFAPSPTGYLHIGNVRTALFNYLFARREGGKFILRIEDTDVERSTKEYEGRIYEDLHWLGLEWDEGPDKNGGEGPYRQSERMGVYKKYVDELIEKGHAYYCYCTEDELEARRKESIARNEIPRYSGKCRDLGENESAKCRIGNPNPTVRFKIDDRKVTFRDIVRGEVTVEVGLAGDFVIQRPDGTPTFHLAVCVDDMLMKVTHVIRGEDHLSNTPRHIRIFEALGAKPPQFAHVSLVKGPRGKLLSKREGAKSITEYRAAGYLPPAIANYLALLGWGPQDNREILTMEELEREFDLSRVSKSAASFDSTKLDWVASEHMKRLSDDEYIEKALRFFGDGNDLVNRLKAVDEGRFKRVLVFCREGLVCFSRLNEKLKVFDPGLPFVDDEMLRGDKTREMLSEAHKYLQESQNFGEETYEQIVNYLKEKTGLKGKNLFMPLRLALTHAKHGAELAKLLPLLGKELCLKRLEVTLSNLEK